MSVNIISLLFGNGKENEKAFFNGDEGWAKWVEGVEGVTNFQL